MLVVSQGTAGRNYYIGASPVFSVEKDVIRAAEADLELKRLEKW